jgi:hypothetical protein
MQNLDAPFYVSAVALICEIILAINNARIAKGGGKINPLYGILPALGFLTFHIGWWMSTSHRGWSAVEYIVGCLASVAFLFGSAFVTTGCLTLKNGELCVDQDNKTFQLFKRLPLEFDGKSLCSISWAAAILLFVIPIVASIGGLIFAVITILICSWTWQNPIAFWQEGIKLDGFPAVEVRKNAKGVWIAPLPWLLAGILIGIIIVMLCFHIILLLKIIGVILLTAAVLFAIALPLYLLAGKLFNDYDVLTYEQKNAMDRDVRHAYQSLDEDVALRPIYIWFVFWQIFRQKFCPKIKYCCKDEMGNTNCQDYDN